jgi:hypothetical protein
MQSQEVEREGEKKEGELFGEIRARLVSRTIKEITPFGIKLESNGEGGLTGKQLSSQHMETVTVFQKTDGTLEWETKGIEMTGDGNMAVVNGRGTGKATGPTTIWGEGEAVYWTQSPSLSWLNGKKVYCEVTADQASREYNVKIYNIQ